MIDLYFTLLDEPVSTELVDHEEPVSREVVVPVTETLVSSYNKLPANLKLFREEKKVCENNATFSNGAEFLKTKASSFVRFESLNSSSFFLSGVISQNLNHLLSNGIREDIIIKFVVVMISKRSSAKFIIMNNFVGKSNLIIASSYLSQGQVDLTDFVSFLSLKQVRLNQINQRYLLIILLNFELFYIEIEETNLTEVCDDASKSLGKRKKDQVINDSKRRISPTNQISQKSRVFLTKVRR